MELKPEALARHLASAELAPVYLLAGDEHLLLIEAADAVRKAAREAGYGERQVFEVGGDFDWHQLSQAGGNLSLFSARRLIELRLPSGRPDRRGEGEGSAALSAWASNPPPDTLLLISAWTWSKAHATKWVDAVSRAGVLSVFWPLKTEEFAPWIAARARRAGLKLERAAAQCLAERVEGNLLAAAQEIDKLGLLAGERNIDVELLEQLVADLARFDVFRLTDAAIDGDLARALRICRGLKAEGEELPPLIGWLIRELSTLARAAFAVAAGAAPDAALTQAGVWRNKLPLFRKGLKRADAAHWESLLCAAEAIDRSAKGRGDSDPWQLLERLLAGIAQPRRLPTSIA